MTREKGTLIVIDGLDGSGKATQAQLLLSRMEREGWPAQKISFPDYANPSSTLVKMYLAGEIGTLDQVNAYAASTFYSVDRYVSFQNFWKNRLDLKIIKRSVFQNTNQSVNRVDIGRGHFTNYETFLFSYE